MGSENDEKSGEMSTHSTEKDHCKCEDKKCCDNKQDSCCDDQAKPCNVSTCASKDGKLKVLIIIVESSKDLEYEILQAMTLIKQYSEFTVYHEKDAKLSSSIKSWPDINLCEFESSKYDKFLDH